MTNFKYPVSFMIILALTLVVIGCAKPPEAERSAARATMDAAMSSVDSKYAFADLEAARKVWETAEAQMNEKKYKEAKQSYLAAKAAFEKAAGAVEAGKKLVAAEVQAAVTALEGDWATLKTTVQKNMKDKKVNEDWTADEKAFTDGLKAAKDMIASDPAGAKGKLDALKSIIAKWGAANPEQKAAGSATAAEAIKAAAKTETSKAAAPAAAVSPAEQKAKVVGNRDSKRYHLPGMKYYDAVEAYHRVEFDSEADAVKAGYHKAPR